MPKNIYADPTARKNWISDRSPAPEPADVLMGVSKPFSIFRKLRMKPRYLALIGSPGRAGADRLSAIRPAPTPGGRVSASSDPPRSTANFRRPGRAIQRRSGRPERRGRSFQRRHGPAPRRRGSSPNDRRAHRPDAAQAHRQSVVRRAFARKRLGLPRDDGRRKTRLLHPFLPKPWHAQHSPTFSPARCSSSPGNAEAGLTRLRHAAEHHPDHRRQPCSCL